MIKRKYVLMNGNSNWNNYSLEANLKIEQSMDDGFKGIITVFYINNLHYLSDNNFAYDGYTFTVKGRDNDWQLRRKHSNGSSAPIAAGNINVSVGPEYQQKIEITNDVVTIYFYPKNSQPAKLVEKTIASPFAAGKFGFGGSDDRISIDNVKVLK